MPYRGAVDAVLARCEILRAHVEELQQASLRVPRCDTLEDALALERRLQSQLDACKAHELDLTATHDGSPSKDAESAPWLQVRAMVAGVLVVTAVFALTYALSVKTTARSPTKHRFLVAGNVVSARAPAHAGDRCTMTIDLDGDACGLDVICPSVEGRFHAGRCHDDQDAIVASGPGFLLDGRHGRLSFATTDSGTLEIELDAWR